MIHNIFFLLLRTHTIFGALIPDYDTNCDALRSTPLEVIIQDSTITNFLEKEVPMNIHQIWFGDPNKVPSRTSKWEKYRSTGWKYRLWTEKDEKEIKKFVSRRNFDLLKSLLAHKSWWAASDLLRYELIREFGGIYLDCDFAAPENEDGNIPLENIFRLKGATFVTEHKGRDIGTGNALFVMNGILCAPAHHPLFEHLCDTIYMHVLQWKGSKGDYNAMYCTGPFFLNRCLNGPFQVLPIQYIHPIMID